VFVVDTNLLIHAAIREFIDHGRASKLVGEWKSSPVPWFITWSIAYEFMRVVTHRSVFSLPLTFAEAWSFIEILQASPSFGVLVETDHHAEVIGDLTREYPRMSGNRLHDLHIAALMREHGVVEIRTADAGFHEFKFLRVVNPL
jgi:toxin-antitoxin system PIN domain toxin